MEAQKINRTAKTVLNNKRTARGIIILNFKLYYRAIVIQTAWHCHKNKHVDQWDQVKDPNIKPRTYGYLILIKKPEIHTGRVNIYNKWC